MTFYSQQSKNIRTTWILITAFLVVVIGIGWLFSHIYKSPSILYFAILFSVAMNLISYWFADKIVLALHCARPVDIKSNPKIYNILGNLTALMGLPLPQLYIIDDPSPNAFATGRNAKHAVVAVTSGLLEHLDRSELEGVLSHELSHIKNRDMLVSTAVVILAGFIAILSDIFMRSLWWGGFSRNSDSDSDRGGGMILIIGIILSILAPLAATIIQLAVSRRREFLADSSGALLTRRPEGLISALKKISAYSRPLNTAANATAHLFFKNPFGADTSMGLARDQRTSWLVKIFSTHPPIEERITALRRIYF